MTTEEIQAAVARFPDATPVLSTADKVAMDESIAALHKAGKPAIEGLIAMFVDRNPEVDCKARHALHALVHHVWTIKDDAGRALLAATMAGALGGEKPKEIQAFLLAQIQLCGSKEVVAALGKVLLDPELCDPACAALMAIRDGAAAPLRDALPKANGRVKLAIIQALGALKDAAAAPALRAIVKDEDRDTRIAACWALASIGDATAIDLLTAATASEGWEQIKSVKNCLVLAENLAAAGKKSEAAKIYRHLHASRSGAKDAYIRDAAMRGLSAINMKLKETVS
mgnify:CR=1 FL=1